MACMPHGCYLTTEQRAEFWSRVDRGDGDECWTYNSRGRRAKGLPPKGYGSFLSRAAHRVSWEMESGREQPPGTVICHRCDNPPCCRPSHLYLGDQLTNAADRVRARDRAIRARDVRVLTQARQEAMRARLEAQYRASEHYGIPCVSWAAPGR